MVANSTRRQKLLKLLQIFKDVHQTLHSSPRYFDSTLSVRYQIEIKNPIFPTYSLVIMSASRNADAVSNQPGEFGSHIERAEPMREPKV